MASAVTIDRPVLADLLPRSLVREVALVAGLVALTAVCAQIAFRVPFSPVPVTGSTFAVLLGAAALGPARAAVGQSLYLALGFAGLPIFTEASGGIEVAYGVTGGYLAGFVVASVLVGALARRGWDRRPHGMLAAFAAGSILIYALGVPWLMVVTGFGFVEALLAGVVPFLVGDALKALAAAALLPAAWRLARR